MHIDIEMKIAVTVDANEIVLHVLHVLEHLHHVVHETLASIDMCLI